MTRFAIAKWATPLLNHSDFESTFKGPSLPLDNQGLLRAIEMIALARTKFTVLGPSNHPYILRVTTSCYPNQELFVDERSLEIIDESTPERTSLLPSSDQILSILDQCVDLPYIWGGNSSENSLLLQYYPGIDQIYRLRGFDCSGLLYYATDGNLPRNTSALVHFGKAVLIANYTLEQIIACVQPLDLIVWVGHVVSVYDQTTTIESLPPNSETMPNAPMGVIKWDLRDRLRVIMQTRKPANTYTKDTFVIRRGIHQ